MGRSLKYCLFRQLKLGVLFILLTAAFLAERLEISCTASTATWPTCSTRALPSRKRSGRGLPPRGGFELPHACSARVRANALVATSPPGASLSWTRPARGGRRPGQDPVGASPQPGWQPKPRRCTRPGGARRPHPSHPAGAARGGAKLPRGAESTTPMCKAAPACAGCGRWAALLGQGVDLVRLVRAAQRLRGFRIDRICGLRRLPDAFGKSPARRWPTCCARWKRRGKVAAGCAAAPGADGRPEGWSAGSGGEDGKGALSRQPARSYKAVIQAGRKCKAKGVQRAGGSCGSDFQDMGVDHRRTHVRGAPATPAPCECRCPTATSAWRSCGARCAQKRVCKCPPVPQPSSVRACNRSS